MKWLIPIDDVIDVADKKYFDPFNVTKIKWMSKKHRLTGCEDIFNLEYVETLALVTTALRPLLLLIFVVKAIWVKNVYFWAKLAIELHPKAQN